MDTKILILQTIGIIFVVLGHGAGVNVLYEWFPYYSFHMPLFIFISGYLFKAESCENIHAACLYLYKKVKRLIIPYFLWNVVYGVLVNVLRHCGIVMFGQKLSLKTLFIEPWYLGNQFVFNFAAWFVLALFLVQVSYCIVRTILYRYLHRKGEIVLLIVFMVLALLSVKLSNNDMIPDKWMPVFRSLFFLFFFHLGFCFRNFIWTYIDRINNVLYFGLIFLVQAVTLICYPDVNLSTITFTEFNNNILIPFITSITAIMFYLKIATILVPSLGNSKIIKYIGTNTWSVMMHHGLIFFLINSIFVLISKFYTMEGIDVTQYANNILWKYRLDIYQFQIVYVILGIAVPILMKCCVWDRGIQYLKGRKKKCK